jgi:hypothetical protein
MGVTALCLLALAIGPIAAQDAALGTANLASPNVLPGGDVRVSVDWRYWESGNDTVTGAIDYGITDTLQIGVTYANFDNVGQPPIAGALRASDLEGYGGTVTWQAKPVEPGSWGVAIAPGVEYLDMLGTNLAIGANAGDEETVFTAEVPFGIPDGDALWIINPKVAVFPDDAPTSQPIGPPVAIPQTIESFGTVVGIGLGIVAPLGSTGDWWVHGDATPIIAGDNTIHEVTNDLHRVLPWSFGVRWDTGLTDNSYLDVVITNAAGGTTATSLIAAPDRSVSVGGKLSVEF